MPIFDPRRTFDAARIFQLAAETIDSHQSQFQRIPWAVNLALAIELYLKSLLFIDAVDQRHGHNLVLLFNELDADTQIQLCEQFKIHCERAVNFSSVQALGMTTDLRIELEKSKDAFRILRYFYEDKIPEGGGFTVAPLANLCRELILKLHPEWLPPGPDPVFHE